MIERAEMIARQLRRRDITDPRVLEAFANVPRDMFVAADQRAAAYEDMPLPIGFGQTISQPYIVALTLQALQLTGTERALDIGTGSGYAAAVIAQLVRSVDTVERIPELADAAEARFAALGLANIRVHRGDGTLGWPEHAPYDAIAVAASAPDVPKSLLLQLAVGGRIVLPVGSDDEQRLVKLVRESQERFVRSDLGDVRFVPLVGAEGW